MRDYQILVLVAIALLAVYQLRLLHLPLTVFQTYSEAEWTCTRDGASVSCTSSAPNSICGSDWGNTNYNYCYQGGLGNDLVEFLQSELGETGSLTPAQKQSTYNNLVLSGNCRFGWMSGTADIGQGCITPTYSFGDSIYSNTCDNRQFENAWCPMTLSNCLSEYPSYCTPVEHNNEQNCQRCGVSSDWQLVWQCNSGDYYTSCGSTLCQYDRCDVYGNQCGNWQTFYRGANMCYHSQEKDYNRVCNSCSWTEYTNPCQLGLLVFFGYNGGYGSCSLTTTMEPVCEDSCTAWTGCIGPTPHIERTCTSSTCVKTVETSGCGEIKPVFSIEWLNELFARVWNFIRGLFGF